VNGRWCAGRQVGEQRVELVQVDGGERERRPSVELGVVEPPLGVVLGEQPRHP
jgi:hypothetical protein